MSNYHKYVFDNNKFVGNFEEMYQNEKTDYDSWFQSDLRDYGYQLSLAILNQYNFNSILDIGCGKGLFTSLLKKRNNTVEGVDISPTAIKKAQASYKDIKFSVGDLNNLLVHHYDLIVLKEVLSYVKNWRSALHYLAFWTKYIFISLDLPENPTGFIKSFEDLENELDKYFDMLVYVKIQTEGNQMLILGKVKE